MTFAQRLVIEVETNAEGVAVGYTPRDVTGVVSQVSYVKDGTVPFADTVDFAVTLERAGTGLWTEDNVTASKTVSPQQPAHNQSGGALTYDGENPVTAPIYACEDRVKVAIAGGGDTKRGRFEVVIA